MGGSKSTSISTAYLTNAARAAAPAEGPEGRKEGGVEDINKSDDGGKKQEGLGAGHFLGVQQVLGQRMHCCQDV
jgi:hypothetical protein